MTDPNTEAPDIAGLRRIATSADQMGEPEFAAAFRGAAQTLEALQAEKHDRDLHVLMLETACVTKDGTISRLREALEVIGEKVKESGNTGMAVWIQNRACEALAREHPDTGTTPTQENG